MIKHILKKISNEVANLNADNDAKIRKEAEEIKNSFSDRKNNIESLYKEKVDLLVEDAFNKIIGGDDNDR